MAHIYPDCLVSNRLIAMMCQGRTTRRAFALKNGLILLNTSRIQLACVAVLRTVSSSVMRFRLEVDRGGRNWVSLSPHVCKVVSLLFLSFPFMYELWYGCICHFRMISLVIMNDMHKLTDHINIHAPTKYYTYLRSAIHMYSVLHTAFAEYIHEVTINTPCRYVQGPPGV